MKSSADLLVVFLSFSWQSPALRWRISVKANIFKSILALTVKGQKIMSLPCCILEYKLVRSPWSGRFSRLISSNYQTDHLFGKGSCKLQKYTLMDECSEWRIDGSSGVHSLPCQIFAKLRFNVKNSWLLSSTVIVNVEKILLPRNIHEKETCNNILWIHEKVWRSKIYGIYIKL